MAGRRTGTTPETETRDRRPAPDEALLEEEPAPQPERREPPLRDPGPTDLSARDWIAILKRAGKETIDDRMPMIASALAYSSFMALPSILLVALGTFTLVAGPSTITSLMNRLGDVMPGQATSLLGDSLQRLQDRPSAGIAMTAVGIALALWSVTGAMSAFMTATTLAYDRDDRRGFVRKRVTALVLAGAIGFAFVLVAVLLIFGPVIQRGLGSALGFETGFAVVWWAAQWPILIAGLLAAFGLMLWLGPDVDNGRWRFLTVGSAIAVVMWLAVSGGFAFYTSTFGSYNKTWGSLAAVIVMLTWLWLSSLALLFGAEVNAEAERSRRLRERG